MKKLLTIVLLLLLVGVGAYYFFNSEEVINTPEINMEDEEGTEVDVDMETENTYMDVSPQEAKTLIEDTENLVIIDVSNRYAQGHMPGAINYYVGDGSLDEAIPTLDKDVPYLVYCHVESVAIVGAQKLIDAGFSQVYRLDGNYSAWVDAGYDIEM